MITYHSTDEKLFQNSVKKVFELKFVTDENKLLLYGLYKQATLGNNKTTQPSILYFKKKAKWHAWKKHSGKLKSQAKSEYVLLVNKLFESNNS